MKHAIIAIATMLLPIILSNSMYTTGKARMEVQDYFKTPPTGKDKTRLMHIERVIAVEGGYQNCRYDRGNAGVGTKYGITPATFKKYEGYKPTIRQMKGLTKEDAVCIYEKIWQDSGMYLLADDVAGDVFDAYVNMPLTSLQMIEKLTGHKGCVSAFKMDTITASIISMMTPEVFRSRLKHARKQYYRFRAGKYDGSEWHQHFRKLGKSGSTGNARYLKGWLSRIEK